MDELDGLPIMATRAFYRSLIIRGLTPEEAGNLTAWRCGLRITAKPWRLHEITKLQARRWEAEHPRTP